MKRIILLLFALPIHVHVFGQFTNELLIPSTLEGTNFDLTIATSNRQFYDGTATQTIGFNGDFLGPTLIFNQGDDLNIQVHNELNEPTTVHWHGMHVSPEDDGGPHTVIDAGTTWNPTFTVLDRATTFWYHPHLHERTNFHVTKGAAGMIIIKSEAEAALELPRTYGVDDFPLIVQGKEFDDDNQLVVAGSDDNLIMVNGTLDPYLDVPSQLVRFRIINGSNERVLNLGFDDNREFKQIGSDGGLLAEPVSLNRVRLASGERAEIVVDFSGEMNAVPQLVTYASELGQGIPGGGGGGPGPGGAAGSELDGEDHTFLEFRVGAATEAAVSSISTQLANHTPWQESEANNTRTITMNGGGMGNPFTLNDEIFNENNVNETVYLDDIEVWSITNVTNIAHPFHIHDVQFYILDKDGQAPPANEQGLKDVVLVEGGQTVRFITKFEDFADPEVPYMYHCHILPHEDGGMMGQFIVVENQGEETVLALKELRSRFRVYPNPVDDQIIRVLLPDQLNPIDQVDFKIYDMAGKEVSYFASTFCGPDNLKILYLEEYESGIYHISINVNGEFASQLKLVMK